MAESKSYNQGQVDAIELWGKVCGSQGTCEQCPIGSIRGTNVTCQDFGAQFPAKMLSLLKEMGEQELSYFGEYCIRFPECNLSVEDVAQCMCRKVVFEGDTTCSGGDCVACWNERYVGDVTNIEE